MRAMQYMSVLILTAITTSFIFHCCAIVVKLMLLGSRSLHTNAIDGTIPATWTTMKGLNLVYAISLPVPSAAHFAAALILHIAE